MTNITWLSTAIFFCVGSHAHAQDAREIVKAAIDHWRGTSSYSEMTMTIHRPDWERAMSMRGWTEGEKKSLVRVMAPARDKNNGTLMIDNNMWTYSPKVNRVIKVPSSMMNQSWMGSDFSNKDVSRADDIVDQYDHVLLGQSEMDGHVVYEVESVPHEEAAVVWGREVLRIRDDNVLVDQKFYDQDGELVKTLASLEIGDVGGRTIAIRQRMFKEEAPEEWTEILVSDAQYNIEIGEGLFTLSNLRNPRD
ncbi:MAG: outer membrane lipoprotein-sorting protein [Gammaproteobacteria bacterium]|nr:outer membrane lipoprotein-sorting protein [Gammaproteobacteria bacterium]